MVFLLLLHIHHKAEEWNIHNNILFHLFGCTAKSFCFHLYHRLHPAPILWTNFLLSLQTHPGKLLLPLLPVLMPVHRPGHCPYRASFSIPLLYKILCHNDPGQTAGGPHLDKNHLFSALHHPLHQKTSCNLNCHPAFLPAVSWLAHHHLNKHLTDPVLNRSGMKTGLISFFLLFVHFFQIILESWWEDHYEQNHMY